MSKRGLMGRRGGDRVEGEREDNEAGVIRYCV